MARILDTYKTDLTTALDKTLKEIEIYKNEI